MPYNLLIFPLIGGYYFITHVYFLKFYNQRIERQRLIFNSIQWGIYFLIVSFLIINVLSKSHPEIAEYFKSYTEGLETSYLGTAILSLLLGLILPSIFNTFLSETNYIKKAILERGTQLERLLLKSSEKPEYVCLTLKNGKVYIGISANIPKPDQEYFNILPFYSGFRNEKHQLFIETQYIDIYKDLDSFQDLSTSDLTIIIKKEEILTARIHKDNIYDFLNVKATSNPSNAQVT